MISEIIRRFRKTKNVTAVDYLKQNEDLRTILIHNHIFKNAGSTIDWALQKNFGQGFVDHRDNDSMRKGKDYLGPYLTQNKSILALSSHHLSLPLPDLEKTQLLKIMMFRHPIERVTSVYNFERKQKGDSTPGVIHARKLGLKDYIVWRMQPEVGATIRNFHVKMSLPNNQRTNETITQETMEIAKQFLSSVEMLGLVERFDESMVLFEHNLKSLFPWIDLSYVAQNIGQNQKENRTERIERLKSDIGEEVFELLLVKNQSDMELYSWVEREFETRVNKIDDFREQLTAFRARCEKFNH